MCRIWKERKIVNTTDSELSILGKKIKLEANSIALPPKHSFFTIMKELMKINLVAINKLSFKRHKETLRGIIKEQTCSRKEMMILLGEPNP
jgi:hypothetical protein